MSAARRNIRNYLALAKCPTGSSARGGRFEAAQSEDDGTLRVTGHHTGPGVSEFFGDSITSYYWAYVIAEDRIAILFTLPGSASLAGLWVVVFGGKAGRRARACIRSGAWPLYQDVRR